MLVLDLTRAHPRQAAEEGQVIPGAEPEQGSLEVSGSYEFVGDDGVTYSVTYTAGEQGFVPQADHLPVAPEQIPEYAQLRQEHPELFWAVDNPELAQPEFQQ